MGNVVYVMPPYCIDEGDLDAIYSGIAAAAERFRTR
jgi:adenosylmethionine-8-amino-7-oxononanoate aminotransferase